MVIDIHGLDMERILKILHKKLWNFLEDFVNPQNNTIIFKL